MACILLPLSSWGQTNVTVTPNIGNVLFSYTAPDAATGCTVDVFSDAGRTVKVNDTNTTLFASSNDDQVRYPFNVGTAARFFTAGTVTTPENQYSPAGLWYPAITTDGNSTVLSRALQTNTQYWYNVTCGGAPVQGTFTTQNIPWGITYPPAQAQTAVGNYWTPTNANTDRTKTWVDPTAQHPSLIHIATLPADYTSHTFDGIGNGDQEQFAPYQITDNAAAVIDLFMVPNSGGYNSLYGVVAATGEVRFYGQLTWNAATATCNSGAGSSKVFAGQNSLAPDLDGTNHPVAYGVCTTSTATGNKIVLTSCQMKPTADVYWATSKASNSTITCNAVSDPQTDIKAAFNVFNASYDVTKFSIIVDGVKKNSDGNTYVLIQSRRGPQDSYAWLGALKTSDGSVAALWQSYATTGTRFCAYHTNHLLDDSVDGYGYALKALQGSGIGQGPYTVSLQTTINNSNASWTIDVTNPGGGVVGPMPQSSTADTTLFEFAVGDVIEFRDGCTTSCEVAHITAINSPTNITITRDTRVKSSHAIGTTIWAICGYGTLQQADLAFANYWNFLQCTSGCPNSTNTAQYHYFHPTGQDHQAYASSSWISASGGWTGQKSYTPFSANPGPTDGTPATISDSPLFSSQNRSNSGNACQKHPTPAKQFLAAAQKSGFDICVDQADSDITGTSTLVTGKTNIYKWVASSSFKITPERLTKAGLMAAAGAKALQDVSGPTSVIQDGAPGNYTVCISQNTDECLTGSGGTTTTPIVYFNIPNTPVACPQAGVAYNANTQMCISTFTPYASQITQIDYINGPADGATDSTGTYLRALAYVPQPWHVAGTNPVTSISPDGLWAVIPRTTTMVDANINSMLLAVTAIPTRDGVSRNDFIQKSVTIPQTALSTNAIVEYGYDPLIFGCASRQETCANGNASQTRPYFETLEQSSLVGYNVTAGPATATLHLIPGQGVAYYRIKQCKALPCTGGNLISTSAVTAISVDATGVAVSISPTSKTMNPSDSFTFTVTVTGNADTSYTCTRSCALGGGSINASTCAFTAPAVADSCTVTGTSNADNTKSATATVSVVSPIGAVSILPASVTLNSGATQQFSCTVTGDATNSLTWSTTATGGSITSGGLLTAGNGAQSGKKVRCTSTIDPSKYAESDVTISAVAVSVAPATVTLDVSATQTFTSTVTGAANSAVTWSATNGTIDAFGNYTAPNGGASDTVTATSVQDGSKTGTAAVTLTSVVLCSISTPASGATVSGSITVTAACTPSGANTINSMQFQLDGVDLAGISCASSPCSKSWQTNALASLDGVHSLTVHGIDTGAAAGDSPAVSITIQNARTPGRGKSHRGGAVTR